MDEFFVDTFISDEDMTNFSIRNAHHFIFTMPTQVVCFHIYFNDISSFPAMLFLCLLRFIDRERNDFIMNLNYYDGLLYNELSFDCRDKV